MDRFHSQTFFSKCMKNIICRRSSVLFKNRYFNKKEKKYNCYKLFLSYYEKKIYLRNICIFIMSYEIFVVVLLSVLLVGDYCVFSASFSFFLYFLLAPLDNPKVFLQKCHENSFCSSSFLYLDDNFFKTKVLTLSIIFTHSLMHIFFSIAI
jgi:hypothetical protein